MKKGITIITLLAVLGAVYWLFFYQMHFRTPFSDVHPLEAVPQNTSLVLEFENYFQTRSRLAKMPYTNEFESAFFVKKLSEDFGPIRKIFSKTKEHRRLLLYSPLMAALQISTSDDADFLYIIKDEKGVFQLEEVLKQHTYKEFNFKGITVFELYENKKPTITIGYYKGIILLSRYAFLVENGMRQLDNFPSPLITENKFSIFSKKMGAQKSKENKEAAVNVYVLFENLPAFAYPFMNDLFQQRLKGFASLISCAKFGLDFKKDGVDVVGLFDRTDESFVLERFFSKEKNKKSSISNIIPDDIAYLIRADLPSEQTMKLQSPNNKEVYKKYFQPWMHEEWAVGCAKIYTRRIQSEQFILYKMDDFKKAKVHLQQLADEFGELKSTKYQTYPIHQILTDYLPIPILGNEFAYIKNPYFIYIEDYVIFAASQPSLENWIDKYLTNQTLSNHLAFLELDANFETEGNISSYWNTIGTLPLVKSFLKPSISGEVRSQIESLSKMQPIGFQLDVKDDFISTVGFFNYKERVEKEVAHLWKTKLDHEIITPPMIHFNEKTEDHQVLIQASDFKLYALNSSGEILWNVLLEDSICSEVVAMDIFQEGEKHYIFNTKKNIVILNFEGKAVHNFPLPLPAEASNGMRIVDFGENEYAFFVGCKNKNVYGYDVNGIPIVGWNPLENVGSVTQSLEHFQFKQKDFLVLLNEAGDLNTYGKDGKKIMKASNVSGAFASPLFFHPKKTDQIVVADKGGSIHGIHVNDKSLMLHMKSDVRDTYSFVAADMAGDAQIDVVKMKGRTIEILYAFQDNFQSKATYQFPTQPDELFPVGDDATHKAMIGTLNKHHAQIFLLDNKCTVHPAFPLEGTTPFELVRGFNHEKNVIVVGNQDEVVVYELE